MRGDFKIKRRKDFYANSDSELWRFEAAAEWEINLLQYINQPASFHSKQGLWHKQTHKHVSYLTYYNLINHPDHWSP